ncbi:MAG: hypothetical protein V1725_07840 [archaeon]
MGEEPYTQQTLKKEAEELDKTEEHMEELEEDVVEETEEKTQQGNFITRLFQRFTAKEDSVEVEEGVEVVDVAHEQLDEDVRLVLKLSYNWLSYLPKSKLDAFKESPDFEIYKEVLKKYGLIK